ncbi:MAG: TIGR04086 family membrane protein [Clostridia bacterium]|nr:TIGR04086 family membrane protein [Clostridia bacterium]
MEGNITKKIINIIKGVVVSIIFTLIALFIFSIILTYTNISEQFISPVIIVTTAISIFIGSSIGNLKVEKNGLINGAMIGGIYLITLYLISSIINGNFNLSMQSIIIIISGMICGMFGGIIGVNSKRV